MMVLLLGAIPAKAQISVRGGNPNLNITTGLPGSEPTPVSGSANTIRYRLQTRVTKITVRTVCAGQSFNLSVVATSVPYGIAAPAVSLVSGMLDTDFITNIQVRPPNTNQDASIRYTASATFAQGNSAELGNDTHTVTYTLIEQ